MYIKFIVLTTPTFDKEVEKLARSDKSLRNKIQRASAKLANDPFQGERVEGCLKLGERRIWVGDSHRLFYDIGGDTVILHHLKKKDKHTYR